MDFMKFNHFMFYKRSVQLCSMTIMYRSLSVLFFVIQVTWICHANPSPIEQRSVQGNVRLRAVVESNVHFSRQLLKVVGNSDSNTVMSPLSAQLALALLHLGTRVNSSEQISSALNIQPNPQPNYAKLIELLQEQNDTEVRIANRVYASSWVRLRPEFLQAARDTLKADAVNVNFGTSGTENAINQWVEETTNGKIKNIVPPGSLDGDTIAVLINALYFKAKWQTKFYHESTQLFHASQTNKVNTKFLRMWTNMNRDSINYIALPDISAQLADFPYQGEQFRFLILLPDKYSSLAALETTMRTQDINALMRRATRSHHQQIAIPKIDLDVTINLREPFKQLGMTDMFNQGVADLTGLTDEALNVYVSKVLQKTFLQLSVYGTEVPSVTPFEEENPIVIIDQWPLQPFIADRPFLFYLVHRTTEESATVLFTGRYVTP